MADKETGLIVGGGVSGLTELVGASGVFGKPEEDKERAPQFEKRVFLVKTLNNAQMFELEDPQTGEKKREKDLRGIIVHFNTTRSWWEKAFDDGGGGNPPDCYSVDSIRPQGNASPKRQSEICADCKRNKFVKEESGKQGKECSDKVELFLWHPSFDLPLFYRVSTMNRPAVTDFVNWCAKQQIRKELLSVRLFLEPTKSKSGVAYDALKIEVTGTAKDLVRWYEAQKIKKTFDEVVADIVAFKVQHVDAFGTTHVEAAAPKVEEQKPAPKAEEQKPAPKAEEQKPAKNAFAKAVAAGAGAPPKQPPF
jgi:hypothetical protein